MIVLVGVPAKDASRGGREVTLRVSLHFGFGDIPAIAKASQMVSSGGYCACRICFLIGIYYKNTTPNPQTGHISGGHVYFPLVVPEGYQNSNSALNRDTIHRPSHELPLRTHAQFQRTWAELEAAQDNPRETERIIQESGEFCGYKLSWRNDTDYWVPALATLQVLTHSQCFRRFQTSMLHRTSLSKPCIRSS